MSDQDSATLTRAVVALAEYVRASRFYAVSRARYELVGGQTLFELMNDRTRTLETTEAAVEQLLAPPSAPTSPASRPRGSCRGRGWTTAPMAVV